MPYCVVTIGQEVQLSHSFVATAMLVRDKVGAQIAVFATHDKANAFFDSVNFNLDNDKQQDKLQAASLKLGSAFATAKGPMKPFTIQSSGTAVPNRSNLPHAQGESADKKRVPQELTHANPIDSLVPSLLIPVPPSALSRGSLQDTSAASSSGLYRSRSYPDKYAPLTRAAGSDVCVQLALGELASMFCQVQAWDEEWISRSAFTAPTFTDFLLGCVLELDGLMPLSLDFLMKLIEVGNGHGSGYLDVSS